MSNILSFRYFENVGGAEKISFDDDLNIIIGENGSGKSTALEVINFLFRRVIYKQYNLNQDLYTQRSSINADQRKQILLPANNLSYNGFRLDPNWNTEDQPQTIRIVVKLDEIDKKNLQFLQDKRGILTPWIGRYTTRGETAAANYSETYTLDIILNHNGKTFSVQPRDCAQDFGYEYLTDYNFYKETIALYNLENPGNTIETLYESFTLISSYRNYNAFNVSISLRDNAPATQIQQIQSADFTRSLNASDNSEPAIFALVRLRVAEKHFGLISQKMDEAECETAANTLPFIIEINKRLRIINLMCKIKLLDLRTWQYRFEFVDLRRNKSITDINSLSAGQKAITHLVFEAYGRGDLKGGLVIIDEPEIHLHYQFQHEYLQVIRELNKHQSCQYILVTHSEALINSATISSVRRFSLNTEGYTEIRFPNLTAAQKVLIRILDNTRSTYAFFAKKVVLVEGDSDRYFFKAVIQSLYQELNQEIAILHVAGKNELVQWTVLFESFGLIVYQIADLDYAYNLFYPLEPRTKLKTSAAVTAFKAAHPDCESRIAMEYSNKTFILRDGDLEHYLDIGKDLAEVITFCSNRLPQYLQDDSNQKSVEVREIVRQITV
ncbi:MAG: AAA family ATPase [Geothrix sp.]|nr:AAA family ATPase [Geothrix sp.]